jgi:hypothetical protein
VLSQVAAQHVFRVILQVVLGRRPGEAAASSGTACRAATSMFIISSSRTRFWANSSGHDDVADTTGGPVAHPCLLKTPPGSKAGCRGDFGHGLQRSDINVHLLLRSIGSAAAPDDVSRVRRQATIFVHPAAQVRRSQRYVFTQQVFFGLRPAVPAASSGMVCNAVTSRFIFRVL